jgi:hypothetical protein
VLALLVGVHGVEQGVGELRRVLAARSVADALAVLLVELPVEAREPGGEGGERVRVAAKVDHTQQAVEGDGRLALQRTHVSALRGLRYPDGVYEDEVRLATRVSGDRSQVRLRDRTRAAPYHLLAVGLALHVAHEDEHLERLHVGAG